MKLIPILIIMYILALGLIFKPSTEADRKDIHRFRFIATLLVSILFITIVIFIQ